LQRNRGSSQRIIALTVSVGNLTASFVKTWIRFISITVFLPNVIAHFASFSPHPDDAIPLYFLKRCRFRAFVSCRLTLHGRGCRVPDSWQQLRQLAASRCHEQNFVQPWNCLNLLLALTTDLV
jgi:hypothetical protein